MAFVIRQVSRSAEGREIVRTATVEKPIIVAGRDAACDIPLADLAVEMRHAGIGLGANGKVSIEALGGRDIAIDGRNLRAAEIDPAIGGELRLGGHLLRIAGEGQNVVVTVERVEAVSDSAETRDEIGLFTLKGLLPGRRIMAWSLIGLVLALFLAWPISSYLSNQGVQKRAPGFHADTMWSSGALSLAHQGLEKNCQACHVQKFVAVTDKACLTCHKDDAHDHAGPFRLARAKAPPGLGGQIKAVFQTAFNHPAGRCVDCHTEHEGAREMPRTAQQFCTDCHGSLNTRLTDTALANASDFGTGHPKFQLALTSGFNDGKRLYRRTLQTSGIVEDNGLKFPHDIHLSRSNGIARMVQTMKAEQGWGNALECADCHKPTADGVRFQPVDMETDCAMCHSLAFDRIGGTIRTLRHGEPAQVAADLRAFYRSTAPPRPLNLGGMARRRPGDYFAASTAQDYARGVVRWQGGSEAAIRAVFSRGGACFDCHAVVPTGQASVPFTVKRVVQPHRYLLKGWFDHAAHKTESCASCHKAGQSRAASDVLIPDLGSCRECHVGGSGDRLQPVKAPVPSSCAMCHDYHIDGGAPWQTRQTPERTGAGAQKIALLLPWKAK